MKNIKLNALLAATVLLVSAQAHAQLSNIMGAVNAAKDVKEKYEQVQNFGGKAKEYVQNNQGKAPVVAAASGVTRGQANCPEHYPVGAPVVVGGEVDKIERRSFFLCREGYAVQFDPQKKTPLWTAEYLSGSVLRAGKEDRTDDFRPDPAVPHGAQATLNDYKGSKFDRGHVTPAADMNGRNSNAMSETFFLTNMIPQVGPNNNRGIWADLEGQVRYWAMAQGRLHVITGPIFAGKYDTMGRSNVAIPTHMYKIVLNPNNGNRIAFIIPNVQIKTAKVRSFDQGNPKYVQTQAQSAVNCGGSCSLENFVVNISQVEKFTGLKFFSGVPEAQRAQLVAQNSGNFSLGKK